MSSKYNLRHNCCTFPRFLTLSTSDFHLAPPPHVLTCRLGPQWVSMSQLATEPDLSLLRLLRIACRGRSATRSTLYPSIC